MKNSFNKYSYLLAALIIPSGFASAGNITDFSSLVSLFIGYVKAIIPLIIALTLLVFLWGIFKLVFSGDSDKAVEEGKKFMTWGIVSLFVMVSVWGLVRLFTKTFFNDQFYVPQLKTTMLIEQLGINRV